MSLSTASLIKQKRSWWEGGSPSSSSHQLGGVQVLRVGATVVSLSSPALQSIWCCSIVRIRRPAALFLLQCSYHNHPAPHPHSRCPSPQAYLALNQTFRRATSQGRLEVNKRSSENMSPETRLLLSAVKVSKTVMISRINKVWSDLSSLSIN